MPGAYAKFSHGAKPTFEVSEVVRGGQLVCEDGDSGRVRVAGDTAGDIVLGMAQVDARPESDGTTTDVFGNSVLEISNVTEYTSLETGGVIRIRNAGGTPLTFGDAVAVAGGGEVQAAGAGLRVIGYATSHAAAGAEVEVQLTLSAQQTALT